MRPEARRGHATLPRALPPLEAGRGRSGGTSGHLGCRAGEPLATVQGGVRTHSNTQPDSPGLGTSFVPVGTWREIHGSTGTPPAPPLGCYPSPATSSPTICRAEPVPPSRTQSLADRVSSSVPAPLPCSFSVVPRIQRASALRLIPFSLAFLSPYPYCSPLVVQCLNTQKSRI